jgi:phenylalanyl-tRNA synthetase beta chain
MKLTLPWLKEHLETEAAVETIALRLTAIGLEIEEVTTRGGELHAFSVARVIEARRHPNAERLSVCTVDTGRGVVEVVCGAPNARTGMKGVFAPVGSTIPATGEALKRTTIRGIESNGMLCSARELGLGEDHAGIIELDADAPVGVPVTEVLRIEGPVIEIAVTPNRADCFGVNGIARELAAAGVGRLEPRDFSPVAPAFDGGARIRLDFPEGAETACPVFVGRLIRGVRNEPSPAWLQARLQAIGLRPISALVDITNYVTFDLARPLHVFDAGKVRGDIRLRLARPGEELQALDGRTYVLDEGMTVICDDSGVVSLAGVMGGERTGCDEHTGDVILEVAIFDPVRTAATGRRLGIASDARTRFERGVDPGMVLPATELATRLIQELCGGEAGPVVIAGRVPDPSCKPLRFRQGQLQRLAGITLESAEIERHLTALGFEAVRDGDAWHLIPPSWRHDIHGEADIVEELVRLHGYDKVPPVPVRRTEAVARPLLTVEQRRRAAVRRALAARGLFEAMTWSFVADEHARPFGGGPRLLNPMSAELSTLRPSGLPGLLAAAARNRARGMADAALFEIGPCFHGGRPGEQESRASGVRTGHDRERHWSGPPRPVDAIDAKADAMAALAAAGVKLEAVAVTTDAPEHYHPGRSGRLMLGPKTVLAEFGELHPRLVPLFELEGPVVGFELLLDRLPRPRARPGRSRPPLDASPYPPVDRDFAFVVAEAVTADALLKAIRSADKALIRDATLFDVYRGTGVPEGHKSMAIAVRLQAADRTLTEALIEPVVQRIVQAAHKATGAELRR